MAVTKPLFVNNTDYDGPDFRMALGALAGLPSAGLSRPSSVVPGYAGMLAVTQTGPSMNVSVASGAASIGGATSNQGTYLAANNAAVNLGITAAHATLVRTDLIIFRVYDPEYGDTGLARAAIEKVEGTPGAGAPALPAGVSAVILAQVAVRAAATTVLNSDITDRRGWAVGAGGILPVKSSAPIANPFPGMHIYETDTDTEKVYSGLTSGWLQLSKFAPAFLELTRNTASYQSIPNAPSEAAGTVSYNRVPRRVGLTTTTAPVSLVTMPAGWDGEYLICASGSFAANGTGDQRAMRLTLNGDYVAEDRDRPLGGGAAPTSLSFAVTWYLQAGDQLKVIVYQDSGGALDLGYGTMLPRLTLKRLSD